jgi:alpha-L-fucosidase
MREIWLQAMTVALAAGCIAAPSAPPAVAAAGVSTQASKPAEGPRPTAAQLAWQDAEIVALIHQDPRITSPKTDEEHLGRHLPRDVSDAIARGFDPQKVDTDQWISTAKDMGATAAVLVVKHELGFCLWQSDANPYCLKMSKWRDGKGDILPDFVASCKKFGLKPGVFTEARWDARLGVASYAVMKGADVTQAQYNHMIEEELKELCTRYGDLFMVWYDGGAKTPASGGPDLLPIAEKYQPGMIFYHSNQRRDFHWCGSESGTTGDPCWSTMADITDTSKTTLCHGDPDGKFWCPAMADAPLHGTNGHQWFWTKRSPETLSPLKVLQHDYLNSVGRNATLVIGILPNPNYEIVPADVARCTEFGNWVKETFGTPLAKTMGAGDTLTLDLPADATKKPAYVVLQEDLRQGERVRAYTLERRENGAWIKCFEGQNIGHKRIIPIAATDAAQHYRVRVTKSTDAPQIILFAAY